MTYQTSFRGSFEFSRELTDSEHAFLGAFCASRRMKWDVAKLQTEFGGKHGNPFTPEDPYGPEGSYFTFDNDESCFKHPAVLDSDAPPADQPSVWCQWSPISATSLRKDGGDSEERITICLEWLDYLIIHFFTPWGIKLNGAVQWKGEDSGDMGVISVRDNRVNVHYEEGESDEE